MAERDPLDYFNERLASWESRQQAEPSGFDRFVERRRRFMDETAGMRAREAQQLAAYKETLIGRMGLSADNPLAKDINAAVGVAAGVQAGLEQAATASDRLNIAENGSGLTREHLEAFQRWQQDDALRQEREALEQRAHAATSRERVKQALLTPGTVVDPQDMIDARNLEQGAPAGLTPEEAVRLNEISQHPGFQTDADRALLAETARDPRSLEAADRGVSIEARTVLDRLQSMESSRERIATIENLTPDLDPYFHDQNKQNLEIDALSAWEDNEAKIQAAWASIGDEVTREGLLDLASSVGDALVQFGGDAVENPDGIVQFLVRELGEDVGVAVIPGVGQVALEAANISRAVESYNTGVQAYYEKHGEMPPLEVRDYLANNAALSLAMDYAGDMGILKGAKFTETGKARIRDVVTGPGRVVASGTGESVTEGAQTYFQGEAEYDPASGGEIFAGTVLGGTAGSSVSAPAAVDNVYEGSRQAARRGVQAMSGRVADQERVQVNEEGIEAAAQSGDLTGLNSEVERVQAQVRRAVNTELDEPTRKAAEQDARRRVMVLQDRVEALVKPASENELAGFREELESNRTRLETETNPQTRQDLMDNNVILESILDSSEWAQEIKSRGSKEQARILKELRQERTLARDQIAALDSQLKSQREAQGPDTAVEQATGRMAPETPEQAQMAVSEVVTRAMQNPTSVSEEDVQAILDNTAVPLTQEQRDFLTRFSEARQLEHQTKDLEGVNQDVLVGDRKGQYVGIAQYRDRFGQAVAMGDRARARRQLTGLSDFAARHRRKAEVAQAAWQDLNEGSGQSSQWLYNKQAGTWQKHTGEPLSEKQMRANGGMTIDGRSRKYVEGIQAEAALLESAASELEAGFRAQFAAPAPVSEQAPSQPAADATAAPEPVIATTQQGTTETSEPVNVWAGTNENAELSNLAPRPFVIPGSDRRFESVEHAYQSMKSGEFDPETYAKYKPGQAVKIAGKKGTKTGNNWNLSLMERLMELSFRQNPEAREALMATGNRPITHTQDKGIWKDAFPAALMRVREKLRSEESTNAEGTDPVAQQPADVTPAPSVEPTGDVATTQQTNNEVSDVEPKGVAEESVDAPSVETAGDQVTADQPAESAGQEAPAPEQAATDTTSEPENVDSAAEADTQASMTQAGSGSEAELSRRNAREVREPILTVLAGAVKKAGQAGTRAALSQMNVVREYLTQKFGTVRPLVSQVDFLSWLNRDLDRAEQYLKEPLTQQQREALSDFIEKAQEWNEKIRQNWGEVREADREYTYLDLPKGFLNEGGSLDENVLTAVSHAAYTWISDMGRTQELNTDQQINAILGRDGKTTVSPAERELLQEVGLVRQVAFNNLGRQVIEALGLTAGRDVPADVLPLLQSQLGVHVAALLVNEGMAEWVPVSRAALRDAVQEGTSLPTGEGKNLYFFRMTGPGRRNATAHRNIDTIVKATRGSQSVINNLFGSQPGVTFPSLTPVPFTQATTKRTRQKVPAVLRRILEKENGRPHHVRQDMQRVMDWLTEGNDDRYMEAVIGVEAEGAGYVHVSNEKKIQGRNDAKRRSLSRYREFLEILRSQGDGTQAFYFDRRAWVMHRVGLTANGVNPQQDKFHRHMVSMNDWEVAVPTDPNHKTHQQFLLAVGDGLGVKTDKKLNETSLSEVKARLAEPVIAEGVAALQRALNGEPAESGDKEAVVAAVKRGGADTHSLDALVNLAHLENAKAMEAKSFKVQMMREVDGVTNGPALAQVLLGAADNPTKLGEWAQKAGFMPLTGNSAHYTHWRNQTGNRDMYETTAADMRQSMLSLVDRSREVPALRSTLRALHYFTGSLEDNGRSMVKTPLTALMFGSSVDKAVSSMAGEFIQSIYDRQQEIANTEDDGERLAESQEFVRQVSQLAGKTLPIRDVRDHMKRTFTADEERAIRQAFEETIGEAVKDSLNTRYNTFLERRRIYNQAANTGFKLFRMVYERERQTLIDTLMERDELPKDGKGRPLQDLTPEQEVELLNSLSYMTPMVNTPFSKASGDRNSGIYLGKRELSYGGQPAYEGTTKLNAIAHPDDPRKMAKSVKTRAPHVTESEPGVRALIFMIHSTDSAISAFAYEKLAALNVHDAHGLSLTDITQGARNLNENTFNLLADFSPGEELTNMLNRVVMGYAQYLEANPEKSVEMHDRYREFAQSIPGMKSKVARARMKANGVDAVGQLLLDLAEEARQAEALKLEFLANTAVVDQYALEGGSYTVTEGDVARIEELQSKLGERFSINKAALQRLALADPVTDDVATLMDNTPAEVVAEPATLESAFGDLGEPRVAPHPDLVRALEQDPNIRARELLEVIQRTLPEEGRQAAFEKRLVALLSKALGDDTRIRYITPETARLSDVDGKLQSEAPGFTTLRPDGNTVYLKSPDFVSSHLTPELVLHELVHAALLQVTHGDQASPEAKALIADLEMLRKEAKSYVASQGTQTEWAYALSDIDEMLAYGLSNPRFQREVLAKLRVRAEDRTGNRLISGMQKFINAVHRALFGEGKAQRPGANVNGLARLIENASGLFMEAAEQSQQAREQEQTIVRGYGPTDPSQFTTQEIFEALGKRGAALDSATEQRLNTLLGTLVGRLHGEFGAYKARAEQWQAQTAEEVFLRSVGSNQAPYVTELSRSGFALNDQQLFVGEQIQATLEAALTSHHVSRRELTKLHQRAKGVISPNDIGQAKWDKLFKVEADEQYNDVLIRFTTLALVDSDLHQRLDFDAAEPGRETGGSLAQRIGRIFQQLIDAFVRKVSGARRGERADSRLNSLAHNLVDVEAKHRAALGREMSFTERLEQAGKERLSKSLDRVAGMADKPFFQDSKSDTRRALGNLASVVAQDRVNEFINGIQKVRNRNYQQRQGMVMAMIKEMQGDQDWNQIFFELMRLATRNQQIQEQAATETAKGVMGAFENGGENLTVEQREVLTQIGVRLDLQSLLDQYGLDRIAELLRDPQALEREIQEAEGAFKGRSKLNSELLVKTKQLGYYLATGQTRGPRLLKNSHVILEQALQRQNTPLTTSQRLQREAEVDVLASLYALRYSDGDKKAVLANLMATEGARTDGGNGVEYTLRMHRYLQKEALERNFKGNPMLMQKGYTKEIHNPRTETVRATQAEGKVLELEGWEKVEDLPKDPSDPDQAQYSLYRIKDRGLVRRVTGILSPTGMRARGTKVHAGQSTATGNENPWNRARTQKMRNEREKVELETLKNGWAYDPTKDRGVWMTPIVNERGEIANYSYQMDWAHRDEYLERNNRIDDVLGAMASSVLDKELSGDQNRQAVDALHEDYKQNFLRNQNDFLLVSPTSDDPEMREAWRLLSPETQRLSKERFGRDELWVRKELSDLVLGYRKKSITHFFEKGRERLEEIDRNPELRRGMREILVATIDRQFGRQAANKLRQAEDIWQETVQLIKDTVVIKNIVTLLGNILSNFSQLWMAGVPIRDITRHHLEAIPALMDYQKASGKMLRLQQELSLGAPGLDVEATVQEIRRLEGELAANPVHEMVESGLMPTIIEDVEALEDPFSYKSRMTRWLEAKEAKIPSAVSTGIRHVLMTHDTTAYRFLYRSTQMSDFVARYTLVNHLMERKRDPLSRDEAFRKASRAFVNYDLPTHRNIQYLNDMGIIPFTKYYLRIQRTIMELMRDNPLRFFVMMAFDNYLDGAQTLMDSTIDNKLGGEFIREGALELPGAITELPAIKMMGGWLN